MPRRKIEKTRADELLMPLMSQSYLPSDAQDT
jgi:hypothetical protein